MENLSTTKTQLLLKIFSQKEEDLNIQLNTALEWSTRALGLEIGIISHIQNDTYTIKKYWPNSSELEIDQQFLLQNTYSSIALQKEDVLTIEHMATSEYYDHSCYDNFKLEAYIGKPFHIEGSLYGTINFSSSKPKEKGFSEDEIMFVRLLSGWVTSTIHRLNIQEDLWEEHRLYKLISTNSAELICMHKLDGTYTYVSPSVKNLLGYSPNELVGTNPYDIFHPDDLKRIADESHAKSAGGVADPTFQYRIKKKDGTYIWFDTATEPVVENGEVIALRTTSRNVSEKKRMEILFQQSQKMAHVGGWEYNLKTGELFWTDEVYRIHEIPVGTAVKVEDGLSHYPAGWPRETLEKAMAKTIENGEPTNLELPFRTAKGKMKWVRVIVIAEFLGTEATKLYGSFQDITKKKRLEELFRESQQMAHVGGWEYNIETGQLYWTDEVYRIHEIPVGTAVKVEDGLSYYPEGGPREQLQKALSNTIETGEQYDLELPFITAKGNNIWIRALGHAELIDGKASKMIGSFQDITIKKEYEEEIKSQLEQLTDLKATREKLYSIIAHDLRNSIYGITGLLELLVEEVEAQQSTNTDFVKKLSLVQMSADNSYKLLDNMLTWVRLQSGLLSLKPATVNIHSTIDTTLDLLQPALKTKQITINKQFNGTSELYAEHNLVSTMLRNLINNAIKFSEPESTIDITVTDNSKSHVSISVKDYGTGMDEHTLTHLFNTELRPQKSGTMNEKGSGLGLILVKEFAELSQGSIKATSKLGEGSDFTLSLPKHLNSY